eukprot:IDg13861t1
MKLPRPVSLLCQGNVDAWHTSFGPQMCGEWTSCARFAASPWCSARFVCCVLRYSCADTVEGRCAKHQGDVLLQLKDVHDVVVQKA